MKRIKYLGFVLVAVLMAGSILSCGPKPPEEPVKIGAILELTGFGSIFGAHQQRGYELALDEVGWEVAGRKIEFIMEDDATDVATGVDKARKLVERDKVDVILGPLFSNIAAAVTAYLQESGTPNLSTEEHGSDLVQKVWDGTYPNVFIHGGSLQTCGYPMGVYAYDVLGYRTATVVESDFVTGWEFGGGFIKAFEERGGEIVQLQRIPPGEIDLSAYIVNLKKADCVAFWTTPAFFFVQQYADYKVEMPLLNFSNSSITASDLQEVGEAALGKLASGRWSALIDTPENKAFVESFKAKYGYIPDIYAEGPYVAAKMIVEAMKFAGGDTSHEAIIDALHKIEVLTPEGLLSYSPERFAVPDYHIFEVVKVGDWYDWKLITSYPAKVILGAVD